MNGSTALVLLHTCVGGTVTCSWRRFTCWDVRAPPWAGMYKVLFNEPLVTVLRPSLLALNASRNSRASKSLMTPFSYAVTWRPGSCLPNTRAPSSISLALISVQPTDWFQSHGRLAYTAPGIVVRPQLCNTERRRRLLVDQPSGEIQLLLIHS